MERSFTAERLLHCVFFNAANAGLPIIPLTINPGRVIVELLTDGEVFFLHEERIRKFSRGTIFWHIEGEKTIWDTTPASPYKCVAWHFAVTSRERLFPRVSQWRGSSQSLDDFISFSRSWYDQDPYDPKLCEYSHAVLSAHASAPHKAHSSFVPELVNVPENSKFAKLLQYIEDNISGNLCVEKLSAVSGISRNQLFREFKRYLKSTPHNYLLERRIAKARYMLEETALPIKEVSESCGFENIEVFYRIFRQFTAMPPGIYRRSASTYDIITAEEK